MSSVGSSEDEGAAHAPLARGGDDTAASALRLAEVVRDHLDPDAGLDALSGLLARIAGVLGYPAASLYRLEGRALVNVASSGFPDDVPQRLPRDAGIMGAAVTADEAVVCRDSQADERWVDGSGGAHRSGVAVPMRLGGRTWGVLVIEALEVDAFDPATVVQLTPVADELAWALEAIRLHELALEQAHHEERLRRGLEAAAAVISAGLQDPDLDIAIDRMVREVREQLGWESLAVLLRRDETLEVAAAYGYADHVAGMRFSMARGILGHVAMTGRPYLARDTRDDPFYDAVVHETRSEICAPLRVAGQVRGVINAESPIPNRFTLAELELMERIAEQMSLVIHNLELLGAEKETVARLHELDRFKSRLLTLASHELRTPLTVVLGFAEVLAEHGETLAPESARDYAVSILRHATGLGRLVDHMLIASEIEQGSLDVVPTRVELLPLVAELISEIDAQIEVRPGLDEVAVRADPFRLRQVLSALIDNAAKYAGDGVIQLDARVDGATTTLLLRDEGPGIPGPERERVFELFHQIGEHGIAGRRGVGLGLTIARDLVKLMDGDLRLASAEGYGVTFLIDLPTG
ncbi:MAG: GAF domain-containing protein [Actinobacteria bacterium]|nr:GAF domain-containing protein [Actinomycetota bacterium]